MTTFSHFGPDFPFDYTSWLNHPSGLAQLPEESSGTEVAIIGAGLAGLVAGYELMKLGLKPVIYEASQLGGRLRSQAFEGATDCIAELGGMRFPDSSRGFWHYADQFGLEKKAFPNPLTEAAGSTVIDLEGQKFYARTVEDLPDIFQEVAAAFDQALEQSFSFSELQSAIREKDAHKLKELWDPIVRAWDERTFYDFIVNAPSFRSLSFRHREIFGQVGFGTGGWDSDFPNSMLEILRVAVTASDDDQYYIQGGVEQLPQKLWHSGIAGCHHWPDGTSLQALNGGATRPGAVSISRHGDQFLITDQWGALRAFPAILVACQSWLLTTSIRTQEALFSHKLWMALDRTRYMQSSKTFVMVDRPFWRDIDEATGQDIMSMTLTDRLTRGTYLFERGPDEPAVICLTYSWMADAMKMLPLSVDRRVELALDALEKIYPDVDIRGHIRGNPITVSWESDPHFLGAFKGALPGHYRYNHRMYGHFVQKHLPDIERGIFLAGDDIGWTPGWAEGAVQTALNAVWGIVHHLGGTTSPDNPGPGDVYDELGPIALSD